jgi:hypothetical protein
MGSRARVHHERRPIGSLPCRLRALCTLSTERLPTGVAEDGKENDSSRFEQCKQLLLTFATNRVDHDAAPMRCSPAPAPTNVVRSF